MYRMTAVLTGVLTAALLLGACSEAVGPKPRNFAGPAFATAGTSGIVLDQSTGKQGDAGTLIGQGFIPTNPHRGDAIIATFVWPGSENIITNVVDHLSDAAATPVGNTYTLVEFVTAGGYAMATYVATNVQNFPDPNPNEESVLYVEATFSSPVTNAGVMLSAWTGVNDVAAYALGAHRSGSGSASGITAVGPGSIPIGAGALAYAVTMSNGLAGRDVPPGFTTIGIGSDALIVTESDYSVQTASGAVDPRWTWYWPDSPPNTWLASVLALNPPLRLGFAVQPSTTLPFMPITPAVQVEVLDAMGNRVTGFSGQVTIAIQHNGGVVLPGTLSGTKTVTVANGVATFSDLSIDQVGDGYTLVATVPGMPSRESTSFNIGVM